MSEKREIELPWFVYIATGLIWGALMAISRHLGEVADALKGLHR